MAEEKKPKAKEAEDRGEPQDESFAEDLAEKAEALAVGSKPQTVLHNAYRGRK